MNEEVAIRIAEALENIEADARTLLVLFVCFGIAFWVISTLISYKN